jgi:hypothetical protein
MFALEMMSVNIWLLFLLCSGVIVSMHAVLQKNLLLLLLILLPVLLLQLIMVLAGDTEDVEAAKAGMDMADLQSIELLALHWSHY